MIFDISTFYPNVMRPLAGKTVVRYFWDNMQPFDNAFDYRCRYVRDRWFLDHGYRRHCRNKVGKSFRKLRMIADDDQKEFMDRFGSLRKITDAQMEEIREFLIKAGEKEFEHLIAPYPYCVTPNQPDDFDGQLEVIANHEAWLQEHFTADRYLAYPTKAIGEHKNCCRNVYFKNNSDAILFKMSVC